MGVTKPSPKPIEDVEAAKVKLAHRCAREPWFHGVGIAPSRQKGRFSLRLTVDPAAKDEPTIPTECDGVPVEVVFLKAYKPG